MSKGLIVCKTCRYEKEDDFLKLCKEVMAGMLYCPICGAKFIKVDCLNPKAKGDQNEKNIGN